MTSAEKLVAKMRGLPTDMPLSEVERVLEYLGWTFVRSRGSHHMFRRDGITLSVPHKSGMVKRVYLKQIIGRERF